MIKKRISALLLALIIAAAIPLSASARCAEDFTDVEKNTWYYDAVDHVVTKGLYTGVSETRFGLSGTMTRAMFITALGRLQKVNVDEYPGTSFTDVPTGEWYSAYVEWGAKTGIIGGVGNSRYNLDGFITREQAAVILYRMMNDTDFDSAAFEKFSDKDKVSEYAVDAVNWAAHHEILKGTDGRLLPESHATRAQVAQLLYNARYILDTGSTLSAKTTEFILYGQGNKPEAGKLKWSNGFLQKVDFDKLYEDFTGTGGRKNDIPGFAAYITENAPIMDDWQDLFKAELKEAYGYEIVKIEELEDGDGFYQAYIIYEGKEVPYVVVNARTGSFHG